MTILTEGYLYRRDKWENVTRENKKWEGQNTTIYYEPGADTQANTGLTFGKTSQRKRQKRIMGGDKYTSLTFFRPGVLKIVKQVGGGGGGGWKMKSDYKNYKNYQTQKDLPCSLTII